MSQQQSPEDAPNLPVDIWDQVNKGVQEDIQPVVEAKPEVETKPEEVQEVTEGEEEPEEQFLDIEVPDFLKSAPVTTPVVPTTTVPETERVVVEDPNLVGIREGIKRIIFGNKEERPPEQQTPEYEAAMESDVKLIEDLIKSHVQSAISNYESTRNNFSATEMREMQVGQTRMNWFVNELQRTNPDIAIVMKDPSLSVELLNVGSGVAAQFGIDVSNPQAILKSASKLSNERFIEFCKQSHRILGMTAKGWRSGGITPNTPNTPVTENRTTVVTESEKPVTTVKTGAKKTTSTGFGEGRGTRPSGKISKDTQDQIDFAASMLRRT